ncbi:Iron complex outermembrane recepter protein OS=Bosea thiooxidans OX=53254 GN=SAMN05660750_04591 PE=3 SV=1 [Bosea thiooxidans]|uniref:Iron complex outermembrane recepter protein n=1 Tax=Bosea thiooxidans TaxID=53254 RepID=A0A1T5GYN1_9HYPH|nr:iron complex outermembrane recepter protein [Bosea thiooxidans]
MFCRSALLASAALAILPSSAWAQVETPRSVQLDEIVVEGAGGGGPITANGYVATATTSGTKTNTPILEIPQSISTVTQAQLEQRKPQNLLDALSYTPGARVGTYGFDPRYDAFTIRGVDVTQNAVFRDGLRQINSPNGLFRLEPYGLEAINVLRGPSSAIYGASTSAGIVDLISKRPAETPFREIEIQGGSFGRKQFNFDLSGPANPEKTLFYRLTGLVRDADNQISAIKDDRVFIAPAITWKPNEATKLTLLAEYMDSTTGGTAAYVNEYGPYIDRSGNLLYKSIGATKVFGGDKRYNDFRQQQGRIGYEFEHAFSEIFTLRQRVRYSALATNQQYVYLADPGLTRERTQGLSVDTNIEAKFDTGPVSHRMLAGVDFSWLHYRGKEGFGGVPLGYNATLGYRTAQSQTLFGIYAQDQISWQNWRLTLGGRHDWFSSRFEAGAAGALPTETKQKDAHSTGRVALSYVTSFGLAPYVSYATSFVPNSGTVLSGAVAVPTTGEQVEAGVKYDLPGQNASLRAAAYELRQNNAVVYEVINGFNRQVQLDMRSRGFEIEGVASLANGLSIQASYSYNDARILKLTPETEGNRLTSIPYHTASLWLDYAVQGGPMHGLGIGGGVRYVGASLGDNLNRSILDNKPRTLVDAALRYDLEKLDPRLKGMRVQVNATNLLDKVEQTCTAGFCYFDEGRKVIASLRYRW